MAQSRATFSYHSFNANLSDMFFTQDNRSNILYQYKGLCVNGVFARLCQTNNRSLNAVDAGQTWPEIVSAALVSG